LPSACVSARCVCDATPTAPSAACRLRSRTCRAIRSAKTWSAKLRRPSRTRETTNWTRATADGEESARTSVTSVDVDPCAGARPKRHGDPPVRRDLVLVRVLELLHGDPEHRSGDAVGVASREGHDRMMSLPARRDHVRIVDLHHRLREPREPSAVPTSLRPKVASWTASSCRVPYENTSSVGGLVVDTFR